MYSTELKVKRLCLAAEIKIIRREERRARKRGNPAREGILRSHRVTVVCTAARTAHLAHAFLQGRSYLSVERNARHRPYDSLDEIRKLVARYGPANSGGIDELRATLLTWMSEAAQVQQAA